MGRYSPRSLDTDGGTVAGVVVHVVSVAAVSVEVGCTGVTWLAMSCRIHSCCSGEKTPLAAVDTAIILSEGFHLFGRGLRRMSDKVPSPRCYCCRC